MPCATRRYFRARKSRKGPVMKRVSLSAHCVGCLVMLGSLTLFSLLVPSAAGQQTDGWRQLPLAEFVQTIRSLTDGNEGVAESLWQEIRTQSTERLLQVVAQNTAADYGDLVNLYLWARPNLSSEQTASALAALQPSSAQTGAWPFEKLQDVESRMGQAGIEVDALYSLTVNWLGARDVRTLENVDQLGWLFSQVQHVDRKEIGEQRFSVQWTGLVLAPANGAYAFSISPLDLNYNHGGSFRDQKVVVFLGDKQILDSSTNGYTYQAEPVTLTAGTPVPLRVELTYACTSQGVIDDRPAIAQLFWEGPGLKKQLVPSTALRTPDGSQNGLQGVYQLAGGGQEVNVTRIDPRIAFTWIHQNFVLSSHDALRQQLAAQLQTVAGSGATLGRWEQDAASNPERWQSHWAFLESLDVDQQPRWVQTLLAHPALLDDCAPYAIANLYSRCRVGAPDESLQAVGRWAQAHADETAILRADFYDVNRGVYRELSRKITWQYRPHLEMLERDYLILPDGRCALPVAYVLSYAYRDLGRMPQWIEKLEAQLADPQCDGDKRVNWLLARAQAEEIRHGAPEQHWFTTDRFLAGRQWIEEAALMAETEAARLRVYKELVARQLVDERVATARKLTDDAAKRCTSPESAAAIAQWRMELTAAEFAITQRHAAHEAAVQAAYVDRLRARYQQAQASGDEAASQRYRDLLSAAGDTKQ